jgi:peptide/nickel transport system substrate-binding protein
MKFLPLLLVLALVVVLIGVSCATPAPTVAPTKPSAPVATAAPAAPAATTAPVTVATKPAAAAPTAAPTLAPVAKIKRGGTVRTSLNTDFGVADLHLVQLTRGDFQVHSESLVQVLMNEKTKFFELAPLLATSWELKDPKTITMKLRPNVKFHDGSDFNAEVAKWNLLRMRDHPKSMSQELVRGIADVVVVDPLTINIVLKAQSPSALWNITASRTRPMMLSKATFDKQGEDYMASHYVGTGPFEQVDLRQGDRLTLKKFANYWDKQGLDGQPKPYLDGVEIRFIQDSAVAFLEMRANNLHFTKEIQPRDVATARTNPDMVLEPSPWSANVRMLGLSGSSGPFKDNLKLRQAAQYAIDRDSMAKTMGQGIGSKPKNIIFEGQLGYSDKQPYYDYDFAKATQLVKDAGFPNGVDMTMVVISRQPDLPQAEIVKAMLDKAGIRTVIEPMERIAWAARTRNGNLDATTYGVGAEVDPYITLYTRMACGAEANFCNYCSKDFDACLAESELATSEDKRGEVFQKCLKIAHDDANFVHLWQQDIYDLRIKRLNGWRPYRTTYNFWQDLWLE